MEQYIVKGGNPLVGEVVIGGAKNAALGILAAAIMADEPVSINNLPDVNDVNVLLEAIAQTGARVERRDRHTARINGAGILSCVVNNSYIKKMRASYYLLGAMLGKYHHAEVALPGGCNIGSRPAFKGLPCTWRGRAHPERYDHCRCQEAYRGAYLF